MIINRYPNIKKVALLVALDNGMINCFRSEKEFMRDQDAVLGADGVYDADLRRLDQWLADLDVVDHTALEIIAAGEQTEMEALCALAPKNADGVPLTGIFDDIFEQG